MTFLAARGLVRLVLVGNHKTGCCVRSRGCGLPWVDKDSAGGGQPSSVPLLSALRVSFLVGICKLVWGLTDKRNPWLAQALLSQAYRASASRVALPVLAPAARGSEFPLGPSLTSPWRFLPFHCRHSGGCTAVSHCGFLISLS